MGSSAMTSRMWASTTEELFVSVCEPAGGVRLMSKAKIVVAMEFVLTQDVFARNSFEVATPRLAGGAQDFCAIATS